MRQENFLILLHHLIKFEERYYPRRFTSRPFLIFVKIGQQYPIQYMRRYTGNLHLPPCNERTSLVSCITELCFLSIPHFLKDISQNSKLFLPFPHTKKFGIRMFYIPATCPNRLYLTIVTVRDHLYKQLCSP